MPPADTEAPGGWVLKHRPPPGGGRWSTVAKGVSYAEAVRLVNGGGDWWILPLVAEPAAAIGAGAAPSSAAAPALFH